MDWNGTLTAEDFYIFNGTLADNVTTASAIDVRSTAGAVSNTWPSWYDAGRIQIPLYAVIFILAVTGNLLVILTLVSVI